MNRPLDEVYAAIFVDAVMVKVRDGQVANRPFYAGDRRHVWRASKTSWGCGPAPAGGREVLA